MVAQKRVAIYARVSTVDKVRTPRRSCGTGNMLHGVRLSWWANTSTMPVAPARTAHNTKPCSLQRADGNSMWSWSGATTGLRSTSAWVNALKEFQSLGVDFISYQEHIDTTTPQGELVLLMASLAQFESALMSERVKAGMARAKAQGKRISRAPLARPIQTRIARLYAQDLHQPYQQTLGHCYGTT